MDTEGRSDVKKVDIFDTTMRDGAQQEGLNLSVQDKLHIKFAIVAAKK